MLSMIALLGSNVAITSGQSQVVYNPNDYGPSGFYVIRKYQSGFSGTPRLFHLMLLECSFIFTTTYELCEQNF